MRTYIIEEVRHGCLGSLITHVLMTFPRLRIMHRSYKRHFIDKITMGIYIVEPCLNT